ncbi:MAG: J domain-containing protein, partial [Myxococcota bacterium]
ARLAEEERRREEEEEAELLRRAEAARLARLRAEADELARAAEARRAADTFVGPPPQAPAPEKARTLLERMNEALRQSAIGVSAAPIPLTRADALPTRSRDEGTDPHFQVPPEPQAQRRPLVLGGQGAGGEEADLWNIVQPANPKASPPSTVQSFEEALRRVDSSLEALVGESTSSNQQEPLVEPIIEAEVETPSPLAHDAARLEDFDVGDPSDPAEAARLRRQRLLRRAMENLGAIQQPQAGEPPRSENVQVVSPQPAEPAPPPPRPSSPSGIRSPTPADLQLAAQIEARHEGLAKKDHFAVLGLTPNATRDQVKGAFLSLAKVFHPDRLPPTLPHMAQKMSAVFEAIRGAYEALHDDSKRAAYAASLAAGAPAAKLAPAQQASELMKMAEVFFKKRDYKQAEQHFQKAHALDKGGQSLAAAAWCIYMDPTRKAEAGEARTMMQKALAIDPDCDRAHYQLGVIARVEGDMETAERHFREAVRVNPRHLEANQEIRLIEMRKKKEGAGKKGGGFFR